MARRIVAGAVPEPDELVGREHLIDCVWRQLEANNVLLVAPRRFGKSGVMVHLLKRSHPGYLPVYLEVEDIAEPSAFCSALVAALLEHDKVRALLSSAKKAPATAFNAIARRLPKVKMQDLEVEIKESLAGDWASRTRNLILELEQAGDTVLFIIDEFPQLADNIARGQGDDAARSFLQWFRSLRLKQKDVLRRHRFVLGGSTSVDLSLRRLNVADKLNDFSRIPVGPLTPEHADALLDSLCESLGLLLSAKGRQTLLELISPPVPYFLQLFVSQLDLELKLRGVRLKPEHILDVYRRHVLGPTWRAYFDPYRQRLKRYSATAQKAAMVILQTIAEAPTGRVSSSTLYGVYRKARGRAAKDFEFDEIMADLECDWYVMLDSLTNEYHFFLPLMRDWWRRFYPIVQKRP